MSALVVDVQNLTHKFGPNKALDGVTLQVPTGTVYGLVGPNGSGKSTLVRALCGLAKPSSGTANVLGIDVVAHPTKVRHLVGYMSQGFSLYGDLNPLENMEFFARIHGLKGPAAKQRIEEVVALMQLGPHLKKPCMALSGGWKQRVALATTILHSPPLMFLDEPTAGVDPVARRELWDILFSLTVAGTDIFVTSQYMDEVERCGAVGYLYLSKLIVTGAPEELKTHPLVAGQGNRYVEIDCPEAIQAVPWMRARPYCKDATVFGRTIHARVLNSVGDARIKADCQAAGLTKVVVRTIEPTLEDVFVSLTQHAAAERAAAMKN